MPRQPRTSSGTGIYHVMMRGINHQTIFEDEEDNYQFINTFDRMRVRYDDGRYSSNPCDSCSLISKFSNPQIFDMTEDYALIDKLQLISK